MRTTGERRACLFFGSFFKKEKKRKRKRRVESRVRRPGRLFEKKKKREREARSQPPEWGGGDRKLFSLLPRAPIRTICPRKTPHESSGRARRARHRDRGHPGARKVPGDRCPGQKRFRKGLEHSSIDRGGRKKEEEAEARKFQRERKKKRARGAPWFDLLARSPAKVSILPFSPP